MMRAVAELDRLEQRAAEPLDDRAFDLVRKPSGFTTAPHSNATTSLFDLESGQASFETCAAVAT